MSAMWLIIIAILIIVLIIGGIFAYLYFRNRKPTN